MMDFLKSIFDYIIDPKRHFSTRAVLLSFIILAILLVNNIMGFTYYYNIHNKIEKANAINQLLKDSAVSKEDKATLLALRQDVLNRKDVVEISVQRVANTYKEIKTRSFSKKESTLIKQGNIDANIHPDRNNIAFAATASGLYILLIIVVLPIGAVYLVLNSKNVGTDSLGFLLILLVVYGLAAFNYYIFGLIPLIRNNWTWNYLLNILLHLGIVGLLGLLVSRAMNRSK